MRKEIIAWFEHFHPTPNLNRGRLSGSAASLTFGAQTGRGSDRSCAIKRTLDYDCHPLITLVHELAQNAVPTVEQCVKEDALEVQDIRELGLGWAWFMNDLRAFLSAWQEMELASPSSEEPVTQIEADVPIEPLALHVDATHLDLDLQVYERPLAVTPFGTPEVVPDWQDTHAMHAFFGDHCLGKWIRTDLGVRTFQGLGKNGPAREQVVRRITRDLHTRHVLEDLLCDSHLQVPLHRRCLPACGPTTGHTRDIQTTFVYRLFPRFTGPDVLPLDLRPSRFPSGGGSC